MTREQDIEASQTRENMERNRRRNNIVVSGLTIQSYDEEATKNTLENFFRNELFVNTTIKRIRKIRVDLHIVEVANLKDKASILKRKYGLLTRGLNVFLYPDRTTNERRIQFEISKRGKAEKRAGNMIKFAHRALIINGARWIWNEFENKLVQVRARSL